MRTLSIPELEKWYEKKLSDKSKDFKKQAERSYKIVQQALRDVSSIAADLRDASTEADAESEGTASRFANKINEIVADFDIKRDITYASTEAMQAEIQYFIQEIWGAGRRWIRRMHKKHKNTIKQLDVFMKELMNEMKKISKLLYEFTWLKDLERIQGRIEAMREITYGTDVYSEQIRQVKQKISQAQKEYDTAKQNYDTFRETSNVAGLLNLDDEAERTAGLLRMKLNTLRKTVKRFSQTDTGVRIGPAAQRALTEYFDDPYAAIAVEPDGYPAFVEGLEGIEKAIENGSINLKDRLGRRSVEEIDAIRNGSLLEFQQKAKEIEQKRVQYAGSDVYAKNNELAGLLDEAQRNLEYHRNDLLKIGDDLKREIEKFEDFKSRVESEINDALDEQIAIKADTLALVPLLEACKPN
jgi:hypothetical protein